MSIKPIIAASVLMLTSYFSPGITKNPQPNLPSFALAEQSQEKPISKINSNLNYINTPNYQEVINLIREQLRKPEIISLYRGERGEKGEQGEKGEAGQNFSDLNSYNPDGPTIQSVYVPSSVIGPDIGTLFSSTMLSADSLNSKSINVQDVSVTGLLNLEGNANFSGESNFASSSITQLNVDEILSSSGAFLSQGGVWTNSSSKNIKENFSPVYKEDILEKLNQLKIYKWNYKNEPPTQTHIGPTAEDFYEIFQLGGERGSTSISTIDPSGIALAAIQQLSNKIALLEDQIKQINSPQPTECIAKSPENQTVEITNPPDEITAIPEADTLTTSEEVTHEN